MLTLAQIRENNKSNTSILYCKNENTPFSQDLINKCKVEFETFVKPIRDRVLVREFKATSWEGEVIRVGD